MKLIIFSERTRKRGPYTNFWLCALYAIQKNTLSILLVSARNFLLFLFLLSCFIVEQYPSIPSSWKLNCGKKLKLNVLELLLLELGILYKIIKNFAQQRYKKTHWKSFIIVLMYAKPVRPSHLMWKVKSWSCHFSSLVINHDWIICLATKMQRV